MGKLFTLKKLLLVLVLGAGTMKGSGQIAAWDFTGEGSTTNATSIADVYNANLDASNLLSRGAGAAYSSGGNSFRTLGFKNDGISLSNTDYFQFTLSSSTGYSLSISTIDAKFAGTSTFYATPGVTSQFAYSLDGTNFTLIGSAVTSTSLTLPQINLSGIAALQNLNANTVVTFRYYASGQTSTGGWGFSSSTTGVYGLAIGGSITSTCINPTSYNVTGGGLYCAGGTTPTVGLDNSQTGVTYQLKKDGVNIGSAVSGNTGSPINFGSQTIAGTYTVLATNGACTTTMNGSAIVTTCASPTKLAITSVSPTSPVAGSLFSVTVQSQDDSGTPANVTSATDVALSLNSGTGTLGGTLTGTLPSGSNSITISGITYSPEESGVKLNITRTSGMTGLAPGISSAFTVLAPAPNTLSSAIIFGSQTISTIPVTSFTAGNGSNRIIIARLASTTAVAPQAGISYSSNSTNFSDALNSTTGIGNKVIYNGNGSGPITLSGLSAGTQYSFDIYEYNGSGATANYGGVYTASRFTLQTEPAVHSSTFTTSSISSFGLTLNFSATTSTTGYIILQKAGSVSPTGIPVDTTAYIVGSTLGDGIVAAFITSSSTTSASINNLLSSTQYTFSIIPFGRNGTNAETYNYYTGGTIPFVSATTLVDYLNLTTINTPVTENFNSMGSSATANLPIGFKIGTNWATGSTTTTVSGGTAASLSTGGTYNFGDGASTTATDRALGFLFSSGYLSPRSIVLKLTNHTGSRITSLDINFDYEKYRSGTNAFNWTFFHGSSSSPTTAATAGDQAYPADGVIASVSPPSTINKTFSITGISISNGSDYYLKWTFAGSSSSNAQAIGIDNLSITPQTPSDATPPVIASFSPTNNSTGASHSAPIKITFSEDVQKGSTGNIVIRKISDNTLIQTIVVTSSNVTISNTVATIAIAPLNYSTGYYVEIDNAAFTDMVGNDFAGITGNSTWSFTTGTLPVAGIIGKNYNFNYCSSYLIDGFKPYSVSGGQIWSCTNSGRTYSGTGTSLDSAIQMNGYASGYQTNEDWLIAPPFNLTSTNSPQLRFYSRSKFSGNGLSLKVSTNYTGNGDPASATWTNLNGKFPVSGTDVWTLSDSIDLRGYAVPNVYLAWVYTSTATAASRWTIDDIKVSIGCTPPSNQPTSLNLTPSITSIAGSFTPAAAGTTSTDNYLVIMSTSPTLTEQPSSATAYAIDDAIGNGTVVSINNSASFEVNNLKPSTHYYYFIYSYTTNQNCYNLTNPLKGDVFTNSPPVCTPPTIQAANLTAANITGVSMDLNYSRGNGDNILVVSRANSAVNQTPINGVNYAAGSQIGTGNYVIYNGSASGFNYAGLTQNTTYYFALYEYSNTNTCYNTSALTANFTTLCVTPVNVSSLNAVAGNSSVSLSWINPTASCFNEILVVASNTPITGSGNDYIGTANTVYSSSNQVVYRGTGTNVTVTGLINSSTYYFKVFTKNGTSYSSGMQVSGTPYNTSNGYVYLFGNLHSHSSYSDGNKEDLSKKPIDDFKFARDAECMDFLGISEHNHSGAGMNIANYPLGYNDANAVNGVVSPATGNSIITLWGMEWGVISGGGHVVVYGFDDKLIGWEAGNYNIYCAKNDYASLFNLINGQPNSFGTLAHPNITDYGDLAETAYSVSADNAIAGMAIESGPAFSTDTTYSNFPSSFAFIDYYRAMLAKGYHLGAQMDGDNHYLTFGKQSTNRMAVLSVSKSRADLVSAIKEMRFYATNDCNVKVDYKCYSNVMGSSLVHSGAPTITINVNDPDMESVDSIQIWGGKIGDPVSLVPIKSYTGSSSVTFDPSDPANVQPDNTTYYYYIIIRQSDGNKIITSPIWYTRKCITTSDETATSCNNYLWNGTTYSTSGNYNYESTTESGCTNIATLHLTINKSVNSSDTVVACNNYSWVKNKVTYTETGVYYNIAANQSTQCQDTATLHLTINKSVNSNTSVTACNSYTWTSGNGDTYNKTGKYYFITSHEGTACKDTATLNLTINYSSTSSENITACDSYTWNNITYTTGGVYTYTTTNAAGCDSTATLNLIIKKSSTSTTNVTACDSYTWNGNTYTTSGIQKYYTTNAVGCDSTATLNLTINHSTTTEDLATSCESYTWHGQDYSESGDYTYQSLNDQGCTNTATLHLIINKITTSTTNVTACDSYTWNGNSYTTSGVQTYHTTNAAGCDSTATLNLIINKSTTSSENVTACDSYTWNGQVYTANGEYTYQSQNAENCTNTATLHLTINHSSTTSETQVACDAYTWHGQVYSESGDYTYQSQNAENCTNTSTLHLTINHSTTTDETKVACDAYSWHGTTYTESGTYTFASTNAQGCTNTAILHLTINYSPSTPTITSGSSTSFCEGGSVMLTSSSSTGNQWYKDGIIINGANNSGYTASISGNYTVIITTNGCISSSSLITNVTVNKFPVVAPIAGPASVCVGSNIKLTDATVGGVWKSGNTSIATINSSGVVSGISSGMVTISYTVTNTSNCSTTVTSTVTVNGKPKVAPITGTTTVCSGNTTQLYDATPSGVWSSSNTKVASVNSNGLVTSVAAGTVNINYSVSNSCGTTVATATVTINTLPAVTIPDVSVLSKGVLPNTIYIGYQPASSITLTANVSSGTVPYSYRWRNASGTLISSTSSLIVSTSTISVSTTFILTVTGANGCSSTASKTINLIDVRCSGNVAVCQKIKGGNQTFCVTTSQVSGYLSGGATLGACNAVPLTNAVYVKTYDGTSNSTTVNTNVDKPSLSVIEIFNVNVAPNPTVGLFQIKIESNKNTSLTIRITDEVGRVIEVINPLQNNGVITFGNNYRGGTYFAEVKQGSNRKIIKLIKL